MNEENVKSIGVIILFGLGIWFAGTSLRTYIVQPKVCKPEIIKVTGEYSIGQSHTCTVGSMALPPEIIKNEDGKEVYVIRCACADTQPAPSAQ